LFNITFVILNNLDKRTLNCRAQLAELMEKVQFLKDKYDASMDAKVALEEELHDLNVTPPK
jgi:hypothetical protein